MCGRYNLKDSPRVQALMTSLGLPDFKSPERFNIAPTEVVPMVYTLEDRHVVQDARWWLTPSWSGGPSTQYAMFNARAETLSSSRAFKAPFRRQRCIIPASSFIEWQTIEGKKQPYEIQPTDSAIAFAGLWDIWLGGNEPLYSFTIVTTDAVDSFKAIHKRMPLMLKGDELGIWLDPTVDGTELTPLLAPRLSTKLELIPIDTAIGNSRNKTAPEPIGERLVI